MLKVGKRGGVMASSINPAVAASISNLFDLESKASIPESAKDAIKELQTLFSSVHSGELRGVSVEELDERFLSVISGALGPSILGKISDKALSEFCASKGAFKKMPKGMLLSKEVVARMAAINPSVYAWLPLELVDRERFLKGVEFGLELPEHLKGDRECALAYLRHHHCAADVGISLLKMDSAYIHDMPQATIDDVRVAKYIASHMDLKEFNELSEEMQSNKEVLLAYLFKSENPLENKSAQTIKRYINNGRVLKEMVVHISDAVLIPPSEIPDHIRGVEAILDEWNPPNYLRPIAFAIVFSLQSNGKKIFDAYKAKFATKDLRKLHKDSQQKLASSLASVMVFFLSETRIEADGFKTVIDGYPDDGEKVVEYSDMLSFQIQMYRSGSGDSGILERVVSGSLTFESLKAANELLIMKDELGSLSPRFGFHPSIYLSAHAKNSDLAEVIRDFFTSIKTGTFWEERYDLDRDPHMKELSLRNPEVFGVWKANGGTSIDTPKGAVEVSNNGEDYFLCGDEVSGSCQASDGGCMNESLMGYVMNGRCQMLVVRAPSGKIQSRAVLKIAFNSEEKPILMLEPVYSASERVKSTDTDAIQAAAKELSWRMGIPIYASGRYPGATPCPPTKFFMLKSRAPLEYSDISRGGQDGSYSGELTTHLA